MKIPAFFALLSLFVSTNAGATEELSLDQIFDYEFLSKDSSKKKKIVTLTKRINLKEFPKSYNPSIIKWENGYLLVFRFMPNHKELWLSNIGVVLLDQDFKQISKPQLVNTRVNISTTPSQSEDARIFAYNGKLYLIFNDSLDILNPNHYQHRDMFISELSQENGVWVATTPLKLYHSEKYNTVLWQKNWVPFVWNNNLLIAYSINPHEILLPDLNTGKCEPVYTSDKDIKWSLGNLRGGTTAEPLGDEYLAFFHSSAKLKSAATGGKMMWHYFMGAYTFSKEPPFELKRISKSAIIGKNFYNNSDAPKRVIFPGGFVITDSQIVIAYGKDDREVWVATIDKELLMETLIPVN